MTALDVAGSSVRATLDDGSSLTADRAIVAAGPWLGSTPAFHDLARDLPLLVERQVQLWFHPVDRDAARAPALPAFIHFVDGGPFVRPEDEATVRGYMRAHLPAADGPLLRSRVCMYTNTPDEHFVVGSLSRAPQVVLLGGFSGHGYKMASVMGEIAADLVERGQSAFDLGMFAPERFRS